MEKNTKPENPTSAAYLGSMDTSRWDAGPFTTLLLLGLVKNRQSL